MMSDWIKTTPRHMVYGTTGWSIFRDRDGLWVLFNAEGPVTYWNKYLSEYRPVRFANVGTAQHELMRRLDALARYEEAMDI